MARFTARQLGQMLGKTAQEVNKALRDAGLLQGERGNYELTEEGEQYAEYKNENNGYGGRAARSWGYRKWDEEVISKISSERFPGVSWFCDNCDTPLGVQAGFDDHRRVWTCTSCGHKNKIAASEIR